MRRGFYAQLAALIVLLVVTAVLVAVALRSPEPPPGVAVDPNQRTPTASPSQTDTAAGPVVSVIGDSFSAASADTSTGPSWAEQVAVARGWDVRIHGDSGGGYLAPDAQGLTLPQRLGDVVTDQPQVVIVAGGWADAGKPVEQVAAAATKLIEDLRARLGKPQPQVVLFSPFAGDEVGPKVDELTTALQRVAELKKATFVDVSHLLEGQPDLVVGDGLPTDAGQTYLAEQIEPLLPRLQP